MAYAQQSYAQQSDVKPEFEERVVHINRCAKVVKGGRRFSFSALVVVGNRNGKVGYGLGKAKEVSECIRKAGEYAKKNMQQVNLRENTLHHMVEIKQNATKVLMRPARPGTGVISGASARAVLELAGVHDVLTKTFGSSDPISVVRATLEGLMSQRSRADFQKLRSKE
jgi:small subunit ribosomal protein S5